MELRELGNRIFRLHAKLIIVALLAGVLGGLALQLGSRPQYQASVLFTMGVQDPQSAEVASVIADTARGIATGPQLVGQAISEVKVSRNENAVASAVTVQTMGSSGIVSLSVTDRDPRVAVGLANALASGVVNTRAGLIHNSLASSLRGLNQQEASVNAQIQKLNAQIAALMSQSSVSAIAQLSGLEARLTAQQDLASQITVQRNNLQAQMGPQTAVIDRAVSAVRIPDVRWTMPFSAAFSASWSASPSPPCGRWRGRASSAPRRCPGPSARRCSGRWARRPTPGRWPPCRTPGPTSNSPPNPRTCRR